MLSQFRVYKLANCRHDDNNDEVDDDDDDSVRAPRCKISTPARSRARLIREALRVIASKLIRTLINVGILIRAPES